MRFPISLLCAACLVAATPEYESLKEGARSALHAGDTAVAEQRFLALLAMAPHSGVGVYEVHGNIVAPLADLYRRTERFEKVEDLYRKRVDSAQDGLDSGLASADLGFFYQASETSSDRFHGERYVESAIQSFEKCTSTALDGEHCRRRLADTAAIQGAIFFQQLKYNKAEPLFRRVLQTPEDLVEKEVLLVSMHALRGILIVQKRETEARQLELRAQAIEDAHPDALSRLKGTGTRARTR